MTKEQERTAEPHIKSSLLRNSLLNIAWAGFQLFGRSLAALLAPLFLGSQAYGEYTFLLWLATLFIQLSLLGFPHAAQRFIPMAAGLDEREGVTRYLMNAGLVSSFVPIAVFAAWELATATWDLHPTALVLLCGTVLLGSFASLRIAEYKGRYDFRRPAVIEGLSQAARLLAILGLLFFVDTEIILLLFGVETAFWLVQSLGLGLRRSSHSTRSLRSAIQVPRREILHYALTVGILVIVDVVVWQRIEIGFLKQFGFTEEAGYFGLAAQIAGVLTMIPSLAILALFPSFAARKSIDDVQRLYSVAASLLWVFAVPVAAIGLFLVPILVDLIYGVPYSRVTEVLPLILIGRLFLLVGSAASTLIYARGLQKELMAIAFTGALLALASNTLLVPRMGLLGAGITVAVVQPLVAISTLLLVHRRLVRALPIRWTTAACAVLTLAAGWFLVSNEIHPFLPLISVLSIFALVCRSDPATRSALTLLKTRLHALFFSYLPNGHGYGQT